MANSIKRDSSRLDKLMKQHRAIVGLKVQVLAKGMHRDKRGRFAISNARLLAIHEFGARPVPARRPISTGLRKGAAKINKTYRTTMKRLNRGEVEAMYVSVEISKVMLEAVQGGIRGRLPPPLAESTKRKPGRDPRMIPLLDTEQLIGSLEPHVKRG